MATRATSFKMLARQMDDDLRVILEDKVAPYMEKVLIRHINEDIYQANEPGENTWVHHTQYQRRGLLPDRVKYYMNKRGNILRVTSTATARSPIFGGSRWGAPGAFLNMLQEGHLGFLTDAQYGITRYTPRFERPALRNAQEEIEGKDGARKIIEEALGR